MIRIYQCFYCVHLIKISREEMRKLTACKAFPEGIPEDMIRNRFIHNKSYPGDHGILFQQDPNNQFKLDIDELAASKERQVSSDDE